jgi:hypothetical protein
MKHNHPRWGKGRGAMGIEKEKGRCQEERQKKVPVRIKVLSKIKRHQGIGKEKSQSGKLK